MKSVIMIAYFFPPEGSAGSYRPLRFVRHLPSMGWQPTVITVATDFYERYDPALLALVPKAVEVIRIRNRDPWQALQSRRNRHAQEAILNSSPETAARIQSAHRGSARSFIREAVHNLEAWCYHPDSAMGWIRPAVKAVCELTRTSKPDVVWASGGPISAFVVARRVSCRTGIPYVLDFRDALTFTPNDFEERRPHWARRLDRRLMSHLLSGARAVVFRYNTEAECFFRAYRDALQPSRIHLIPNGFEGDIDEFKLNNGNKLKILYTGALSDYRYDTLLEALHYLSKSSPDFISQLHFQFVGEGMEALYADAVKLGLADMITTSGPISHESITRLSRETHALLILGRPSTKRGYELFAGAKLFGYLKAGTPILGVLPNDETRKILRRVGVTTVADVDSVDEIVAVLRRLFDTWSQGSLDSLLPERSACETYSAKRQTQDLVRALEGAPPSEHFVPGLSEVPLSLREEIVDCGAR
jgi:hypothetical protein